MQKPELISVPADRNCCCCFVLTTFSNFYLIIEVRCTMRAFSFVLELLILKTKQMYFLVEPLLLMSPYYYVCDVS